MGLGRESGMGSIDCPRGEEREDKATRLGTPSVLACLTNTKLS